jgi:hypothetical protein
MSNDNPYWHNWEPTSRLMQIFTGKRWQRRKADPPLNRIATDAHPEQLSPAERKTRRRRIEDHERERRRTDAHQISEKQAMTRTERIIKNTARMGEFEFTRRATVAAKEMFPSMTPEAAFAKLLTEDTATQRLWLVSKGVLGPYSESFVTASMRDEDIPAMYPGNDASVTETWEGDRPSRASREMDAEDNTEIDQEIEEDADGRDDGAYKRLMKQARALHQRDPSRSVAQHFSRLYTTPGSELAQLERVESMAKLTKSMLHSYGR